MQAMILLVEDDHDHRRIVSDLLSHAGYQVLIANDGQSGVEAALRFRPAVTLMDVSLPILDGWSATARIKSEAPELCVIIVTANAFAQDQALADVVGADRFVIKPVVPTHLLKVIRECLEASEP